MNLIPRKLELSLRLELDIWRSYSRSGQKVLCCRQNNTLTPSAIIKRWNDVEDFSQPSYPTGPANFLELLENAQGLGLNGQGPEVSFKDKVVVLVLVLGKFDPSNDQ